MPAVRLTVVESEFEAASLCALLETAGVRCFSGLSPTYDTVPAVPGSGPYDVFVDEKDLEQAQAVLADVEERREAMELAAHDPEEEIEPDPGVRFWSNVVVAVPIAAGLAGVLVIVLAWVLSH